MEEKSLRIDIINWGKLSWVNVENPGRDEMDYLARHFNFHPLDLDDCLSKIQRPKIDEYPDYLFMVLHFPVFDKRMRVTQPSQVSIFLGDDFLVTVHKGDLKPIVNFFKECKTNETAREEYMGSSASFLLYTILDRLVNYCFPILNKIGENIEKVEDMIFGDQMEKAIREIALLRRDVIHYRRIIKPQTEVFEHLEKNGSKYTFLKEAPHVYFGDLADHCRKIQDTLEDYREVIEGFKDTNDTLASFRINQVMRILTVISTIMLPLTLIASIYGMNVPLPGQGSPYFFPLFILFSIFLIGAMLFVFRKKRWI